MELTSQQRRPLLLLWRMLRAFAIAYALVVVIAMLLETRLVYPAPTISEGDWHAGGVAHSDVTFRSRDGTMLNGWYFQDQDPQAYVVFFHGNAEDITGVAQMIDNLRKRFHITVFAFDYRGYGHSEGRPNESGLIEDGCAAQRWLARRANIPLNRVVLWGRSLGGGVAVGVAIEQPPRALILERTFSSMVDVAAFHDPWLPIRLLMRNRYNSAARIAQYHGPLFQAHGSADEVVPMASARSLFAAAASAHPRQFIVMPNVTHNGPATQNFYRSLGLFLRELP